MRTRRLGTLLLFLFGTCLRPLSADPTEARTLRLDNGLRVTLRPAAQSPNVALVVLFSIGAEDDPPGQSGLGHLIEHLYVTSAAGRTAPRRAEDFMTLYPAGWNAQTGDDYTVIATVFPREALDAELDDAAARMNDLRITDADVAREVPRLLTEVGNMFEDFPLLAAMNQARERVRPSPAGGRKGGIPAQVSALDLPTLQERARKFYRPGNARLVLAGGFDPAAAEAAIRKRFGELPAGEPAPPRTRGPGTATPATDLAELPVGPPGLPAEACVAFAAPAPDDPLYASFLVLAARLALRAPALAVQPGRFPFQWAPLDDPCAAYLGTPLLAGESGERAIARLDAFVAEAVHPDLEAYELEQVRNQYGFLLAIVDPPEFALAQNPYGIAFGIGRRDQLGLDPAALRRELTGVTKDSVRRAAEAFLGKERRAAVVIESVR